MPRHRPRPFGRPALLAALLVCAGASACVTENVETGEMVPRGEQHYPWDKVVKQAEKLKVGMSKLEVLAVTGSPAEKDSTGDVWIYLPERYAILIPAQALRLEFKDHLLADFGYRPIVLGARL